ncbi:MAG: hypothetical protein L6R28_04365 [Planctomycetes bacterium]|nr:hypothetical protein [Planctomycetota bacterium]
MPDGKTPEKTGGAGCLARIYWMFLGNAVPLFAAILLATEEGDVLAMSIIFWGGIAALLLVRLVDVRMLNGQTGDGKPADLGHWTRYAAGIVLGGLAIYGGALALAS